jgi:hypothetical protein
MVSSRVRKKVAVAFSRYIPDIRQEYLRETKRRLGIDGSTVGI